MTNSNLFNLAERALQEATTLASKYLPKDEVKTDSDPKFWEDKYEEARDERDRLERQLVLAKQDEADSSAEAAEWEDKYNEATQKLEQATSHLDRVLSGRSLLHEHHMSEHSLLKREIADQEQEIEKWRADFADYCDEREELKKALSYAWERCYQLQQSKDDNKDDIIKCLTEALATARDDLYKAANQFASMKASQKLGHFPLVEKNDERFEEKAKRAGDALIDVITKRGF